jgi:hypothetical protein
MALIVTGASSCGSVSVMYNQTGSMTGSDFSLTTVEAETQFSPSESQFKIPVSFGYALLHAGAGPLNLNGSNYSLKQGEGFSFGLNPTYDFTRSRVQPFATLRLGMGFLIGVPLYIPPQNPDFGDGEYIEEDATAFYAAPQIGVRCYITRNIAIFGSGGYQLSRFVYDKSELAHNFTGVAVSFGLTYAF